MEPTGTLDDDARYRAVCAHDARFDGRFFAGVTSTGIYCRPICRVRTPRRENCRFFEQPAQAEQAGFRPCLRCRPELAPLDRHWSTEDASALLVRHATRLMDAPQSWASTDTEAPTMGWLAERLGVSDRHLRRVFDNQLGVSPLQYLLTRRLLAAKQLLADTALPVSEVAMASGFGSLRRFNAAFQARYGLNPTQMRRGQTVRPSGALQRLSGDIRLSWRPPYNAAAMLGFLAGRQLPGVEYVDTEALTLQRTLRVTVGARQHSGWLAARLDPASHRLVLRVSDGLLPVLPSVIWRVREVLDLDADPSAINRTLHTDFPEGDGLRVPGCFDGFELAVRAVLGQQVTVQAARTLATRVLSHFGEPIAAPGTRLDRLFPSAQTIAAAEPAALGELGIVRLRQAAILALARAVADGVLELDGRAPPEQTVQALLALPGIGPWTAQYIAMRALRWPDAWPTGDVALHQGLGLSHLKGSAAVREAAHLAEAWHPWRSYAVVRAWSGLHHPSSSKATP